MVEERLNVVLQLHPSPGRSALRNEYSNKRLIHPRKFPCDVYVKEATR